MDRDIEKASTHSGEAAEDSSTIFAPIQSSARRQSAANSRPSTSEALSRAVSQNGYGCEDGTNSSDDQAQDSPAEKDPFEVGWEGGDEDPMCPRSFGKVKKWTITIIVSMASFCV